MVAFAALLPNSPLFSIDQGGTFLWIVVHSSNPPGLPAQAQPQ
jgi:hypothetical protein